MMEPNVDTDTNVDMETNVADTEVDNTEVDMDTNLDDTGIGSISFTLGADLMLSPTMVKDLVFCSKLVFVCDRKPLEN